MFLGSKTSWIILFSLSLSLIPIFFMAISNFSIDSSPKLSLSKLSNIDFIVSLSFLVSQALIDANISSISARSLSLLRNIGSPMYSNVPTSLLYTTTVFYWHCKIIMSFSSSLFLAWSCSKVGPTEEPKPLLICTLPLMLFSSIKAFSLSLIS